MLSPEKRHRLVAESAEPANRAWGAYRVGQHRLAEAIPLLIEALRAEEDQPAKMPRLALRAAILDALFQCDAKVASKDLAPHVVDLVAPAVMILIARNPADHHDLLTDIFDHPELHPIKVWLVAGNLLARESAPGFVAGLLGRLSIRMEIEVREGEGPYRGSTPTNMPGDSVTPRPEGYPPLVAYKLHAPGPVDFLVVDGPRPIHAHRLEAKESIFRPRAYFVPSPDVFVAQWIADRLRAIGAAPSEDGIRRQRWWRLGTIRDVADVGPPARPKIRVRWAGAPPLLRQTQREHEALEGSYWEAVRQLLEAGQLTREEAAGLSPKISFTYLDKRRDRRISLPDPPVFPTTNPWRKELRPKPTHRTR